MKETQNNIIYSWTFEDKKHRGYLWYIIVLSIIIGLVIWGFLTKQYGMSFLIILITGVAYFVENNTEDNIIVNITDLGINVSNIFYDFSRIKSYSFIYNNDTAVYLRLILNKRGIGFINLKVDNNIVTELNKILPNFLEENPKKDLTFTERLIELLKL